MKRPLQRGVSLKNKDGSAPCEKLHEKTIYQFQKNVPQLKIIENFTQQNRALTLMTVVKITAL